MDRRVCYFENRYRDYRARYYEQLNQDEAIKSELEKLKESIMNDKLHVFTFTIFPIDLII